MMIRVKDRQLLSLKCLRKRAERKKTNQKPAMLLMQLLQEETKELVSSLCLRQERGGSKIVMLGSCDALSSVSWVTSIPVKH